MIYESPIELLKHYENIGKTKQIAECLFDAADDDLFYGVDDRNALRKDGIPRISEAIKKLPIQLIGVAEIDEDDEWHQIVLVPLHKYDTEQIENPEPIDDGDKWTYRVCRKWSTYCFDVSAIDDISNYLSIRPHVDSVSALENVPTEAWNGNGFVMSTPDFVPSRIFATAPVVIEDSLSEQDELEAVASVVDVIAMYGFDLKRGDKAKEADIKRIQDALARVHSSEEKTYDAKECIDEIMRAHGFTPKPEEAVKRDNAITMESVWLEFEYETRFVRNVIAPISNEIKEMAKIKH